jgi:hemolysin activation/secretion protein
MFQLASSTFKTLLRSISPLSLIGSVIIIINTLILPSSASAQPKISAQPDAQSVPPNVLPNAAPISPQSIYIQRFKIIGSTVFRPWELENVTQPYENQPSTLDDLQKAADAVTRYYLDNGYFTSRAVLADQKIVDGVAYIQVIEGKLENIEITGNQKVNTRFIKAQIARAQRAPLNQESLENVLRLLRSDPLWANVEASLQEGETLGSSNLSLRLTEAKSRFSSVSIDNHNPESIGKTSLNAILGNRNLTGSGDLWLANYAQSLTGGSRRSYFLYQRPFNPMQGTVSLRISPNQFRITQADLKEFDIAGRSDLYELGVRQPIVRQPNEEIALGLGIVRRTGVTAVADFLTNASQSTSLRFSQDLLKRDYKGLWIANSQINLGMSKGQATDRETNSQFLTWTGQLQRLQFLGKNHAILAALNWQLTGDSLPANQKFNLGGAQSLRGYPHSFFSADNGIALSIEQQWVLKRNSAGQTLWKLSPFIDLGAFWDHTQSSESSTESSSESNSAKSNLYSSAGIGLTWQPMKNWSVQIDVALPLRSVDPDGGLSPAFYFNSSYEF